MTTARDLMSKKLVTLDSTVSPIEIAKIMDKNNVSCVVLTINEKPHGIVTEKDLLSKVVTQNMKLADFKTTEIMSSPLIEVSPLTPADEVAEKMILNKIRRVVVIDKGQPVGIITVTDFLKYLHPMLANGGNYNKNLYQDLIEDFEYWTT
jgi:signal-transduction protein with cAMP-binding, CBS, and nucleotidyltransferase domain